MWSMQMEPRRKPASSVDQTFDMFFNAFQDNFRHYSHANAPAIAAGKPSNPTALLYLSLALIISFFIWTGGPFLHITATTNLSDKRWSSTSLPLKLLVVMNKEFNRTIEGLMTIYKLFHDTSVY